ncbi:MAG: exonuclease SbcCD subunit D C-terminal domain-containing protein [Vicinamibacteria bacterium]
MKIVHTSDWHVGRRWKGIERLAEMETVLDHLGHFIESEKVDLVLHTGDIFDSRNPPAESERLVNRFFVRVSRAGAHMVLIAGNHDDPGRLDARALLAEYVNVRIVGRPRSADKGGTQMITTRSGEKAVVAALPFASPGAWVSALQMAGDEGSAHSRYARMFQAAVQNLSEPFRKDAVNLFMAHTHLEGAVFGESERRVHIGEDWAATTQTLPTTAAYIALGHIHKPQKVGGTLPAYYAGSPLQLDFGETGQEKTFVVVTAAPGKPAKVTHVPYEGGFPLLDLRATLPDLESLAEKHRHSCWLRVTVPLAEKDPDLSRKVREILPNALVVKPELPETEATTAARPDRGASPALQYGGFHLREHQLPPAADVAEAFERIHAVASGMED